MALLKCLFLQTGCTLSVSLCVCVAPDQLSVLTELVGITSEWNMLATVLRIPEHEIAAIETNHSHDVKTCLRKMVDKWLKLQGSRASWTTLSQALRHTLVNRPDIAECIELKCLEP